MYIDEATERENMILGMDYRKIKDEDVKAEYWRLRDLEEE